MATTPAMPEMVLDAVLLPPPPLADQFVRVSRALSVHGSEFVLDQDDAVPHLSLYMGRFEPESVSAAVEAIRRIAAGAGVGPLTAQTYGRDPEHGMIEVTYATSPALTALQQRIIDGLDPLRSGLREWDPVGRRLPEWLPRATGEARTNLERYGYDEIGSLFRPHVTVARFRQRDRPLPADMLPAPAGFSGRFPQLALFEMGPHGTCTRCLVTVPLAAVG